MRDLKPKRCGERGSLLAAVQLIASKHMLSRILLPNCFSTLKGCSPMYSGDVTVASSALISIKSMQVASSNICDMKGEKHVRNRWLHWQRV